VEDPIRAVAALGDPQRARLYRAVRAATAPITREDAARQVGISRKLAAFHLDRLVKAGLLDASFERSSGGTTTIGRTPKRYRAADVELSVSLPERHYELVAEILLDAIEHAGAEELPADAARRAAYERGHDLGVMARAQRKLGPLGPERGGAVVTELLGAMGFEPACIDRDIVQRNCPFHRLAQQSPALVCSINHGFVCGMLDGLEVRRLRAALEPADGRCCVVVSTT
jgi:predicted ArsR family transcriptional regulator